MIRIILSILYVMFLVSCVKEIPKTDVRSLSGRVYDYSSSLKFYGIKSYRTISDTRIEIDFNLDFDISTHQYSLEVGERPSVLLKEEDLIFRNDGSVSYIVENLEINNHYKMKVSVKEISSIRKSENENEIFVGTYSQAVADFKGIKSLGVVPGQSDNRVVVGWDNPTFQGLLEAMNEDPVFYIVSYSLKENEAQLIGGSDDSNVNYLRFPSDQNQFLSVSNTPDSFFVNGLTPDTEYSFRIRAIHKSWYTDYLTNGGSNAIPIQNTINSLDRDLNTKTLSIKTDSPLGPANFDQSSLQANTPPNISGYDSVDLSWEQASGRFYGYRVFVKELVPDNPGSDTLADELLQAQVNEHLDSTFFTDFSNNTLPCENRLAIEQWGCFEVSPMSTSFRVSALSQYKFYQFKLAVCRDNSCTVLPGDLNQAIMSNFRYARTEAQLVPFDGIETVDHPQVASDLNPTAIALHFNPFEFDLGYADTISIWCVDPVDVANGVANPGMVQFPGGFEQPIAASGVGNCDTLYVEGNILLNSSSINIRNVNDLASTNYASSRYCFALAPAINGKPETKSVATSELVIKCINPEVNTPSSTEFAGLSSCSINENSVTLNWTSPTSGLYDGYKVMWMKKNGSNTFNYGDALSIGASSQESVGLVNDIDNVFDYEITPKLALGTNSLTITDFMPGETYSFAVLSTVDKAGNDIYSEHNLNIKDCSIPLPQARFEEWTRVFAIGPKTNGLVPKRNPYHLHREEAYLYEAINRDGIPYELFMNNSNLPDLTHGSYVYRVPPGNYDNIDPTLAPASFNIQTSVLDARKDSNNFFASKKGIISLAWKETANNLEFLSSMFISKMDNEDALNSNDRSLRKWGYKVYRSENNRVSWINVTDQSGLLHSKSYSYYSGQPSSTITSRMVFFTDYSVETHESTDKYEYARKYWYRIIPVFNGKELSFFGSDTIAGHAHNEIEVTLPPTNMALVHRMMANRRSCLEISRSIKTGINPNEHYSCDFNGVGSKKKPTASVLAIGQTGIDQGGDLLIDRFELGCNITRGHLTTDLTSSRSLFHYDADAARQNYGPDNTMSHIAQFKGLSHDGIGEGNNFMGCVQPDRILAGEALVSVKNNYASLGDHTNGENFNKVIWGDCFHKPGLAESFSAWETSSCDALGDSPSSYWAPGIWNIWHPVTNPIANCSDAEIAESPHLLTSLTTPEMQREYTIQAEHLAVLYIDNAPKSRINPKGPSDLSIVDDEGGQVNCMINLASIGSKEGSSVNGSGDNWWRSRWVGTNEINNLNRNLTGNANEHTVSQISTDTKLYDSISYRYPHGLSDPVLPIDGHPSYPGRVRYDGNTPLGMIYSENSAHLPPLKGINIEDAQALCNIREVKIGYSDGSTFNTSEGIKKKRLPRRVELIAAGAWPENQESSSDTVNDKQYNETSITEFEKGSGTNYKNACNGQIDPETGSAVVGLDDYISGTSFVFFGSSGYIATGSSHSKEFQAGGGDSTEYCTSQYGIQDLVGNVSELTSEALVCDYNVDSINYGPYLGNPLDNSGSPNPSDSINLSKHMSSENEWQNNNNFTPQFSGGGSVYDGCLNTTTNVLNETILEADCGISYNGILTGGISLKETDYILKDAPIYWLDSNNDINSMVTANNKIWKFASINSGYCSIISDDIDVYEDASRYVNGSDIFNPIKLFDGSLNATMIPYANPFGDQEVFELYRDGDGFFMNFGPRHQFVSLSKNNSLAISNASLAVPNASEAIGNYFNPIVGLPLSCGSETPIGGCGDSADNKLFTMIKDGGGVVSSEFFLGNSNVFNTGLSQINWEPQVLASVSNDGFFTENIVLSGAGKNVFPNDVIDYFVVGVDGKISPHRINLGDDVHDPALVTLGDTSASLDNGSVSLSGAGWEFTSAQFSMPRGERLHFNNGGSAYKGASGRFSASVEDEKGVVQDAGFRCAVKINEN